MKKSYLVILDNTKRFICNTIRRFGFKNLVDRHDRHIKYTSNLKGMLHFKVSMRNAFLMSWSPICSSVSRLLRCGNKFLTCSVKSDSWWTKPDNSSSSKDSGTRQYTKCSSTKLLGGKSNWTTPLTALQSKTPYENSSKTSIYPLQSSSSTNTWGGAR